MRQQFKVLSGKAKRSGRLQEAAFFDADGNPIDLAVVKRLKIPFSWDDEGLLTGGKFVYRAKAGERFSVESAWSVTTAFDGTSSDPENNVHWWGLALTFAGATRDPEGDGIYGGWNNSSLALLVSPDVIDGPYYGSDPDYPAKDFYNPLFANGPGPYFAEDVNLVLVADNGAGGDPGFTQGEGVLHLLVYLP